MAHGSTGAQVTHHPSNVDLQIMQKLLDVSQRHRHNFRAFLTTQFSCIDRKLADDIVGAPKSPTGVRQSAPTP